MCLTRRIARNVGSIPSGYVLGRVSGGYGPTELLNPTEAVRSANVTPRYTGTVTSIGLPSPAEIAVSGSPTTSNGTIGLSWSPDSGRPIPSRRVYGDAAAG
jgi:hypothetical protein